MCKHVFEYPDDKKENYNPDGETLTGVCRCGAKKKAYGMLWMIPKHNEVYQNPMGKKEFDMVLI